MSVKVVRYKWDQAKAEAAAIEGSNDGSMQAAQFVLQATNQVVPLDTGALMGTGNTNQLGKGVAQVYYDTPYAVILHQHPEWNFQNGRRGQFLKGTMQKSRTRVLEFFGKALKAKFSRKG